MNSLARLLFVSAAVTGVLFAAWAVTEFRAAKPPSEPGSPVTRAAPVNARVTISTEGALSLMHGARDDLLGSLDRADALQQRETLDRLRLRLDRLAAMGSLGADGWALGTLDVAVAPATPWSHVLWVLEVATSPTVRTRAVRLLLPGTPESAVTPELSYGRLSGVDGGSDVISVLRVQLERVERTTPPATRVRMALASMSRWDWDQFPSDGDTLEWMTSWTAYREARALTAQVCGTPPSCRAGVLDIARPERSRVTFGEVFDVLRALRDEGVAPVWILNRSTALPEAR
jgi:hypothetical protein